MSLGVGANPSSNTVSNWGGIELELALLEAVFLLGAGGLPFGDGGIS